jgi:four helix bundle protein
MSRDRHKLDAFHLADNLAFSVYEETRSLRIPDEDLRRQLRRAAVSVPANIAEGCGRRSKADYARFLDIALGSANEADYLLDLTRRTNVLNEPAYARCKQLSDRAVRALQKLLDAVLALP